MKLYINQYGNKKVARLEQINEFTGEKKVYKGFLNPRKSENGEFEYCELVLERNNKNGKEN